MPAQTRNDNIPDTPRTVVEGAFDFVANPAEIATRHSRRQGVNSMRVRTSQKGAIARATVQMTIGAMSRRLFDSEMERLRHSVIPLVGADRNRKPYVAGSAILLELDSRRLLITAAHVAHETERSPLHYFDGTGRSQLLDGRFSMDDNNDLAVLELTESQISDFKHLPFLSEKDLRDTSEFGGRFYAGVAGYPSTCSKSMDNGVIDTRMVVIAHVATEKQRRRIAIAFNNKEGFEDSASGAHVTPPDPDGMSGGAIFSMPLRGMQILTQSKGRLAGIATDWKSRSATIEGTSVEVLLSHLRDRPYAA